MGLKLIPCLTYPHFLKQKVMMEKNRISCSSKYSHQNTRAKELVYNCGIEKLNICKNLREKGNIYWEFIAINAGRCLHYFSSLLYKTPHSDSKGAHQS